MKQKGGKKRPAGAPQGAPHKKKGVHQKLQSNIPLPADTEHGKGSGSEDEFDVSDEDMEWVAQHSSRLGFLTHLDTKALDRSVKANQEAAAKKQQKQQAGADNDAEGDDTGPSAPGVSQPVSGRGGGGDSDEEEAGVEEYERVPRSERQQSGPKSKGLPIKTLDGDVKYEKEDGAGPGRRLEALPKASELVQVEGITVEDELEVTLSKREKEAAEKAEAAARKEAQRKKQQEREAAERALPPALTVLQALEDRQERLQHAKEVMAAAANKLLSGPEEAVGELKTLTRLCADEDKQIARLAMVSLLAVFKDIAPGYRIRPPSEKELQVKVSKEVQKLRDYESALLKQYQAYLKQLLAACQTGITPQGPKRPGQSRRPASPKDLAHSRVALKCLATLLTSLPHFNYASDLLQAVVPHMASSDSQLRAQACGAIRQLLGSTETQGKLALEAVQLVADLVRKHNCVCPAEVVQVLHVLKFSEVKPPKSDEDTAKVKKTLRKQDKKREEQRKKDEKKRREQAALNAEVERDMREAEAGPDYKALAIQQSQMLEALFEIYFRVLKACTASPLITHDPLAATPTPGQASTNQPGKTAPGSHHNQSTDTITGATAPGLGVARERLLARQPLLYAVLEGLGRYAHLISVEYFNDIMEVFLQLLRAPGLPVIDRLRVLLTASDILKGQGEALNIDRRELHAHLYLVLLTAPMRALADDTAQQQQPSGQKSAGSGAPQPNGYLVKGGAAGGKQGGGREEDESADPENTALLAAAAACSAQQIGAAGGRGAAATQRVEDPPAVLLGAALSQFLCEPKSQDMPRLAAFAKRCTAMAANSPTPEALVMLGCVMRLMRRNPRLQSLLEWDGEVPVGGRSWKPDCPDPSEAGGLAACLWELPLLTQHYHPHIAQAASTILAAFTVSKASSQSEPALSGPLALPGGLKDLAQHYAPLAAGSYRPAPTAPGKQHKTAGPGKRLFVQAASEEWGTWLQHQGMDLTGSAGTEEEEEEEGQAVVLGCLNKQFRVARRFEINAELREKQRRLTNQIQQFQVHLHELQKNSRAAHAGSTKQQPKHAGTGKTATGPAAGSKRPQVPEAATAGASNGDVHGSKRPKIAGTQKRRQH